MTVVSALVVILVSSACSREAHAFVDDLVKAVTKEDCMNGTGYGDIKEHCCHDVILVEMWDPNSNWSKCMKLVKKKGLYTRGTMRNNETISLFSTLVQCYYKRRKYIGPGKSFNMKRIKSDAAARQDPFEGRFLVDMYADCAQRAKDSLKQYEANNPAVLEDEGYQSRRMFLMIAHICVNHYSETTACPYFHWASIHESENAVCQRYNKHCRQLMREIKRE